MNEGKDIEGLSETEVLGRIYNPVSLEVDVGNLSLLTISGFSQDRKGSLHYILPSEEAVSLGFSLIGKDGRVKTIDIPGNFVPLETNEVEAISLGNDIFRFQRDAWCNVLLAKRKSGRLVENKHYAGVLGKVVNLWEAAVEGEDKFESFLRENVDETTLGEIRLAIDCLKLYPKLQGPTTYASRIRPWDLAKLATFEERKSALTGKQVSSSFFKTEAFTRLMEITEKIRSKKPLTQKDESFLHALAVAESATAENVHSPSFFRITSLNERYVVANLVENYFMRSLVPKGAFRLHQKYYLDFAEYMRSLGVNVPEWFTSYRGDEFSYGPAVDSIIANVRDRYFFFTFGETPESMAGMLNHERLHFLLKEARKKSGDQEYKGFCSGEAFVESLALLIKYKGDIRAILAGSDMGRTSYCQGVKQLLEILDEINRATGDSLLGVKLLFQGLTDLATGKIRGNLEPLERFYDENNIGKEKSFAETMAPFSDSRRIYLGNEVKASSELPKAKIKEAVFSVSYEEAKQAGFLFGRKQYQRALDDLVEHPLRLLSAYHDQNQNLLFYERVFNNPEAREELQTIIDNVYRNYVQAVKEWIAEIKRLGKLPALYSSLL